MAKGKGNIKTGVEKYAYPSKFGSHASMVVKEKGEYVLCRDEFGIYATFKSSLDNGLADKNRYRKGRHLRGRKEK